jgi:signal transduction histidine kinase
MLSTTESSPEVLATEGRRPAGGLWGLGQGFTVHAWSSTLAAVAIVLIWAASGAGDFWPVWVILPLLLALAIHGWLRVLNLHPSIWRRPHVTFALAVEAGVWVSLLLFNTGIWGAGGGGSFWPVWPAIGLGVAIAIHASVIFFTEPSTQELSERIDVLTSTRAGAVDAEEDKLRRIERDLHDGAQARLVALGMSLGMAEQKLADAEPTAAQELLAEARVGAEQALRELRDLARGIHPPVLADRGLEAAVRSLADLSPLRVDVSVELDRRPPAAVESAAYFVSAESLANAAKHAQAQRVEIRIGRRGDKLRVEIADDGRGGANPAGSGLRGLRRRVEALDGTLLIDSPPGGPTLLRAELPCAQ